MEEALAEVFARAFYDDPIFHYMLGSGERPSQTRWVCRQGIRMPARFGHGVVAVDPERGDAPRGGAFWVPPGEAPNPPLWQQIQLGNLGSLTQIGLAGTRRILAREAAAERRYRRFLREPHWVLDFVAVDPGWQGRGVGGAMLRPMLRRIDEERRPAFLLTYERANLGFYRALGFEVVDDERDGSIPPCFAMRRPPQTDQTAS